MSRNLAASIICFIGVCLPEYFTKDVSNAEMGMVILFWICLSNWFQDLDKGE